MRKAVKVLIIIFIVLIVKWLVTYSLNELIISNYHNEKYNKKLINVLYPLTLNSSYVVYYNDGNINYKLKNYDKAIEKYNKALKKHPSKKRVCDIRINLSLSMLAKINIKDSVKILQELRSARYVLYEDECVDPNYENSYSVDAENLEKEIKKLEEQLQNQDNNQQNNDDNQDNNNNNQEENDPDEEIENQLKENEQKANESRQEELNRDKNLGGYDYYHGKRW